MRGTGGLVAEPRTRGCCAAVVRECGANDEADPEGRAVVVAQTPGVLAAAAAVVVATAAAETPPESQQWGAISGR